MNRAVNGNSNDYLSYYNQYVKTESEPQKQQHQQTQQQQQQPQQHQYHQQQQQSQPQQHQYHQQQQQPHRSKYHEHKQSSIKGEKGEKGDGITNSCNFAMISGNKQALYITDNGQVGVTTSSILHKDDIKIIDQDVLNKLLLLQPVTFTYKSDDEKSLQFGLNAEDVDKILPELVITKNQRPFSVKYDQLVPILLAQNIEQQRMISQLCAQVSILEDKTK